MHANFRKSLRAIPLEQGFTLVEILIAMALGLIIIGGAFSYFLSTLTTSKAMLSQSKLQQEVRASADLMQRDIRRAGHRPTGDLAAVTTVYLGSSVAGGANNCILYSYIDERGTLRQGGFTRHSDNRLYIYIQSTSPYTAATTVNTTCPADSNPSSWASNGWTAVTPPTANSNNTNTPLVTGFSVASNPVNPKLITLTISSTLSKDSAVQFSLRKDITLHNAPTIGAAVTGN